MTDPETEWFPVELDRDGAIIGQILVTQYIHLEGTRYCVTTKGTNSVSTLVGLLEMAKHDLLVENDD